MKKKIKKVVTREGIRYTIDYNLKEYGDDSIFEKRADEAKKFLEKVGVPNFPPLKK